MSSKFFSKQSAWKAATFGIAFSIGSMASLSAQTKVTFELRGVLDGVNGDSNLGSGGSISPDGHVVTANPGSVVVFQLFANIASGNNASLFTTLTGSIVSQNTVGDLVGALRGGTQSNNVPNFTGVGAQGGLAQELTSSYFAGPADQIGDVGDLAANAGLTGAQNYFVTSSALPTGNGNNTPSILIGEFQLTLAAGTGSTTFGLELRPRTSGSVSVRRHVQFNDGAGPIALDYLGNGVQDATPITDGIAYQNLNIVVIPEPSVAVTLLGGVATLLGFRRRKH